MSEAINAVITLDSAPQITRECSLSDQFLIISNTPHNYSIFLPLFTASFSQRKDVFTILMESKIVSWSHKIILEISDAIVAQNWTDSINHVVSPKQRHGCRFTVEVNISSTFIQAQLDFDDDEVTLRMDSDELNFTLPCFALPDFDDPLQFFIANQEKSLFTLKAANEQQFKSIISRFFTPEIAGKKSPLPQPLEQPPPFLKVDTAPKISFVPKTISQYSPLFATLYSERAEIPVNFKSNNLPYSQFLFCPNSPYSSPICDSISCEFFSQDQITDSISEFNYLKSKQFPVTEIPTASPKPFELLLADLCTKPVQEQAALMTTALLHGRFVPIQVISKQLKEMKWPINEFNFVFGETGNFSTPQECFSFIVRLFNVKVIPIFWSILEKSDKFKCSCYFPSAFIRVPYFCFKISSMKFECDVDDIPTFPAAGLPYIQVASPQIQLKDAVFKFYYLIPITWIKGQQIFLPISTICLTFVQFIANDKTKYPSVDLIGLWSGLQKRINSIPNSNEYKKSFQSQYKVIQSQSGASPKKLAKLFLDGINLRSLSHWALALWTEDSKKRKFQEVFTYQTTISFLAELHKFCLSVPHDAIYDTESLASTIAENMTSIIKSTI